MPKRSNTFQKLILLLHQKLAGEAVVTESKMLIDRDTGNEVEVDVVVESLVSGIPMAIGIECTAKTRRATIEWYRSMVEKHRKLDISQTVLVSKSGFTREVRLKAENNNVRLLTLEEAEDYSWVSLVNKLRGSIIVNLQFKPKHIDISFDRGVVEGIDVGLSMNSRIVVEGEEFPVGRYLIDVIREAGISKNVLENYKKLPESERTILVTFSPVGVVELVAKTGEKLPIKEIKAEIEFNGVESELKFETFSYAGTPAAFSEVENIFPGEKNKENPIVSLVRSSKGEIEGVLCVPNKEKGDEFFDMNITPEGKKI